MQECQTMKKIFLAGAAVLAMTVSAFANQCPADMASIDEALKTASLSDADKAKVMELRKQGEELHKAGTHDESVKVLGEAKAMLGI
jgi:hypothetical protein